MRVSVARPDHDAQINVLGTVNLLQAALDNVLLVIVAQLALVMVITFGIRRLNATGYDIIEAPLPVVATVTVSCVGPPPAGSASPRSCRSCLTSRCGIGE